MVFSYASKLVSSLTLNALERISDTSDITYRLILVVISNNIVSEDADKILAAVIACCAP